MVYYKTRGASTVGGLGYRRSIAGLIPQAELLQL